LGQVLTLYLFLILSGAIVGGHRYRGFGAG